MAAAASGKAGYSRGDLAVSLFELAQGLVTAVSRIDVKDVNAGRRPSGQANVRIRVSRPPWPNLIRILAGVRNPMCCPWVLARMSAFIDGTLNVSGPSRGERHDEFNTQMREVARFQAMQSLDSIITRLRNPPAKG